MAWAPKFARNNEELVRLFNENMRGIESELARRPQASTTETKIRTLPIASPIVGLQLGETSTTAYRGDRGKVAYDHSQATGNPHGATASDIGAATASHAAQHGASGSDPITIQTSQISNVSAFMRTVLDDASAADARTTLDAAASSHAHGAVTTDGKIGTTAGLPVTTGTGGTLQAVAWSTTAPVMNGTAAVGTSVVPSRSDHVHPADTSRAPSTTTLANNAASSTLPTAGTATALTTLLQQIRDYLVGLTAKFTDGSVTKVGIGSVGSTSQPIYLNSGVPTAITGTISNSTTGNAATATKLATARAIALTGDVTGSVSFDGSANVSITTAKNYEFDYTGAYSASNVDFAMKIASWVPSSSTTYSIMFEFDYAGVAIYPWQNFPFSVIVTYRDGNFNVYYEMIGNHAGYSRIYCGMNSTTAEIWVLGYGSYIRFKGIMISQSHAMYNVSGSVTSTIPAYLTNMGNVVRNASNADTIDGKRVVVTAIASKGTDANTLYFCY